MGRETRSNWGRYSYYGKWESGYEPDWFAEWRAGELDRQRRIRAIRLLNERQELRDWVSRAGLALPVDLQAVRDRVGAPLNRHGLKWLAKQLEVLGVEHAPVPPAGRGPTWRLDLLAWFRARVIPGEGSISLQELAEDAWKWVKTNGQRGPQAGARGVGMLLRAQGVEVRRRNNGMVAIGVTLGDAEGVARAAPAKPVSATDHGLI